nr:MAG: hypothetical protein [Microvirus Sku15]
MSKRYFYFRIRVFINGTYRYYFVRAPKLWCELIPEHFASVIDEFVYDYFFTHDFEYLGSFSYSDYFMSRYKIDLLNPVNI